MSHSVVPPTPPPTNSTSSSVSNTPSLTVSPPVGLPRRPVVEKRPFDLLNEVIQATRPIRVAFRVDGNTVNIDHVQDFYNVLSGRYPHDLNCTRNYNLVGVMLGRKDDEIIPFTSLTTAAAWKDTINHRSAIGPSITSTGSPTAGGMTQWLSLDQL